MRIALGLLAGEPLVENLVLAFLQKTCDQCLQVDRKIDAIYGLIARDISQYLVLILRRHTLNIGVQLKLNETNETCAIGVGLDGFE